MVNASMHFETQLLWALSKCTQVKFDKTSQQIKFYLTDSTEVWLLKVIANNFYGSIWTLLLHRIVCQIVYCLKFHFFKTSWNLTSSNCIVTQLTNVTMTAFVWCHYSHCLGKIWLEWGIINQFPNIWSSMEVKPLQLWWRHIRLDNNYSLYLWVE